MTSSVVLENPFTYQLEDNISGEHGLNFAVLHPQQVEQLLAVDEMSHPQQVASLPRQVVSMRWMDQNRPQTII